MSFLRGGNVPWPPICSQNFWNWRIFCSKSILSTLYQLFWYCMMPTQAWGSIAVHSSHGTWRILKQIATQWGDRLLGEIIDIEEILAIAPLWHEENWREHSWIFSWINLNFWGFSPIPTPRIIRRYWVERQLHSPDTPRRSLHYEPSLEIILRPFPSHGLHDG